MLRKGHDTPTPQAAAGKLGESELFAFQDKDNTRVMTIHEREWCLQQIDKVEGFDRAAYEKSDDAQLARGVLHAWLSFCQDKGLTD